MLMLGAATAAMGHPTAITSSPSPAKDTDWWTQIRHDAGNTGATTTYAPNTFQVKWQTTLLEGINSAVPLVVDDHVFINTNSYFLGSPPNRTLTLPPPTMNARDLLTKHLDAGLGAVYCLDAKTGASLWRDAFISPNNPAYLDGKLYFTDMNTDAYQGHLYCLDAASGTQVYAVSIDNLGTTPVVTANNKLYYGGINLYMYSGSVSCASLSGSPVWSYAIPGNQWIFSAPAVDSGNIYFITNDMYSYYYSGNIYCLNAETGAYKWSHPIGSLFFYFFSTNSPAAVGGKVYASDFQIQSYSSYLRCYDGNTGSSVWTYPIHNGICQGCPTVSGGSLYACVTDFYSYETDLVKLFATNGTLQWRIPVPGYFSVAGASICSADKVIVTSSDYSYNYVSFITALDKTTGEFLWGNILPVEMIGGPSLAADTLYCTDYNGGVYAVADQLKITGFHGGLLRAKATLANEGNRTFANIAWRLSVNGGYFEKISLLTNGTIPSIDAGKTATVPIGPLFGIGKIHLDFMVTPEGGSTFHRTADGMIIGPLILIQS